jgi:hypothetical protein
MELSAQPTLVALMERFAKDATTEGRKSPIFYDDEVIGFGLQVRDSGSKTFDLTTPSRAGAGATSSATN